MLNPLQNFTLAAVLALCGSVAPATANTCLEEVGCVSTSLIPEAAARRLSCDALYTTRNWIYRDANYCFKSPKARGTFGNEGCRHEDEALLPLNSHQRTNIQLLRRLEADKGC